MDKRIYLLAAAGVVIAGLCAFRLVHPPAPRSSPIIAKTSVPAPGFELYDQSAPSKIVRLAAFLGRHRVLVVFFDGKAGADHSNVLRRLAVEAHRLRKAGVYILAISSALPQQNRKLAGMPDGFPFPLLSDPDFHVHRAWGRFDADRGAEKDNGAVFLVDRKGWVAANSDGVPQPLADWQSTVEQLEGME